VEKLRELAQHFPELFHLPTATLALKLQNAVTSGAYIFTLLGRHALV
jgi:hypothetical protein